MQKLLEGKTAIITGSNRGIGLEIARCFAENGADIYAHARTKTEEFEQICKTMANDNCVKVTPVYFDLLDAKSMKSQVQKIKRDGAVDILVNNAAVVESIKPFQMTSMDEYKREFDVNYFAQIELIQYVSRLMRDHGGSIVNITACAAMDAYSAMLPYVSSKSAMNGASRRLAIELAKDKIRVNALAPGLTESDMGDKMSEQLTTQTLAHVLMGRKAHTREIANVALFLASDMSTYMTGQIIRVDGGMLL